ncbi:MAG: Rpn family recombination-promoting nuclease/putative transposase [Myxococcota bacterium]
MVVAHQRTAPRPRRHGRSASRSPPDPHDRFFRFVFSKPQHARGLVRQLLGPTLARRFDWSTLELVPRRYVDARLGRSACDVLFSVRFRRSRRRALLYLLLEHQRKPDPMMPFRMLKYACRAWEDYVERSDAIDGYLPPIIPLLVHQDPKGWRGARSLSDLHRLDGEDEVELCVPPFIELHMQIHELKSDRVDVEALTVLARTALQLLRLIATGVITRENAATLNKWFIEIQDEYGHEALEAVMCYLESADRSHTIMKAIEDLSPYELFADVIPVRGSRRARDIAKGRSQGKQEGQAKIVLRQLRARFRRVPRAVARRVNEGTMTQLERWAERLLTADSLDEVFAENG